MGVLVKPLCLDLFCGLGGWAEGLLAEGYRCIGYDIEAHDYGTGGYPGELRLQDVLTLHGSEFKDATVIVASPPCQKFSYMAMPWSKAKALIRHYEASEEARAELTALFDACFRIQREAIEATRKQCPSCGGKGIVEWYFLDLRPCERCEGRGFVERHIPLIVENVRGAQRWVGRAKWHYGSYYLWGDLPALMPVTRSSKVGMGASLTNVGFNVACVRKLAHGDPHLSMADGRNLSGFRFDGSGKSFQSEAVKQEGCKGIPHRTAGHWTNPAEHEGTKQHGSGREWFAGDGKISRLTSSKSPARKAASALIAKIPFPLAQHVARSFKPEAVKP